MKYIIKIIYGLLFLVTTSANAATYTWDGSSSNLWNTAANWDLNAVPPAGSDLVFPSGASNISTSNDIAAGTSFASITFGAGASAYTLAGNAIILSGGATAIAANNTSLTMTISLNITFSTAAPTISIASGGTLNISGTINNGGYLITHSCTGTGTISGVISGSGGFTKSGTGTLTLSASNTFAGTTTISDGVLKLGATGDATNTPLGTTSGATSVASNASLDLAGYTLGTAEALTLNGNNSNTGTLKNSGSAATYSGNITINAGTYALIVGPITLSGNISQTSGNLRFAGVITVNGIIQIGTGQLQIYSGSSTTVNTASTHTGGTFINNSTLILGHSGALSTSGTVTLNTTTSTLDLNGITPSTALNTSIKGTGVSGVGAIINSSSTSATYPGLITLTGDASIMTTGGNITISNVGSITGAYDLTLGGSYTGIIASILATSTGGVTKSGSGTWILSGANTYDGLTTISSGTLRASNASALGSTSGATTITGTAAPYTWLDISGVTITGETVTLNTGADRSYISSTGTSVWNGTITIAGTGIAALSPSSGTLTVQGTIGGSGSNLYVRGDGDGIMDATISVGGATLAKTDNGTWTINSTGNTWGNTLIVNGKVKLGAAGVIPDASAVTISTSTTVLDMNTYSETVGSITGDGTIDNVAGGGTPTLTCGGNNTSTTFSGIIQNTTGILGITKTGTGTLTLSGANTYSGTTTVSSGILKLGSTTALGTIAGATSVTSGAALDLNGQTYANSEALTLNGTGVSSGGALLNSSATAATFPGLITLGSASSIIGGTGTIAISNVGTITGATFGLTLGGAQGGSIASIIGTTSGNVTKQDAGTWTLSGTNTFTGVTTINAGVLSVSTIGNGGVAGNLGQATNAAGNLVLGGGTLQYTGATASSDRAFTLTASTSSSVEVTNASNTLTISGTSATSTGSLTKIGSGKLILSGDNSFSGGMTLTAGNLTLGHNNALGTGTLTINGGTTIGGNYTIPNVPIVINGSFTQTSGGTSFGTGTTTLNADITITVNNGLTIGGVIGDSGNGYGITKAGSATLILSGASTYTGKTSVTAGPLSTGTTAITNAGVSGPFGAPTGANATIDVSNSASLLLFGTTNRDINAVSNGAGTITIDPNGNQSLTLNGNFTFTGTGSKILHLYLHGNPGVITVNTPITDASDGSAVSITSAASQTHTSSYLTLNAVNTFTGSISFGTSAKVSRLKIGSSGSLGGGNYAGNITMLTDMDTRSGFEYGSSASQTLSGVISGNGYLTVNGTGTLTLSGTNTYSGATTVTSGTLSINTIADASSNSAIGTGATTAAITIGATGTLKYTGTGHSSSRAIVLSGSGGSIDASGSGDLTLSGGVTGNTYGLVLTGTGNATLSGVINTTSGTLSKSGSGTWTLSGANTFTGTTTISVGTLVLQDQYASTSHVISSGAILELNRSADLQYTASTSFTGTGILRKTGAGNVEWGGAVATFALSSGALIDVQTGTITGGHSANEVWTNNYSDLNVESGALFNSVEANVRVDEITGSGNIYSGYNGSGYANFTFGVDNGSSNFTGVLANNSVAANFVKEGTGTITLSGTNIYTGTTTVSAGILKLNNTAALGTNAAGTTVSSGAALDLNGITYSTTEALTISGTGVSSGGALINTGASASFAGTVTLAADATINTSNQITLSGTISPSTYSLTKAGTNSLVFTSNTATVNDLTISAGTLSAGSSTINIYGNLTNSGTFTCGTGTVAFNGTTAQSIAAATFNNLTINNTTSPASSAATLAGNITVGGALTMTTGILNTSSNTITLGTTATISETNPSATAPTSYVTGTVTTTRDLVQNVTNTFGGIGVSLTETTQASNSTIVTRQTGTASTGAGNQSILRYFDITPTVDANLNGTMVFSYIDSELNSQDEASFKLYKSSNSGSTWAKQASSSVSTGANTLSLSGITSFSRWTASNTSTNPLPVEFSSFTATKEKDATALKWETAQEINNDYFDIERSHDGINFEKITSIKGVGTTNSISNYSYLDKSTNLTLATYYRLKQVDFDKKTEYSNIVFVNGQTNHKELNLFPNPLEEGKPLYACLGDNDEGIIKVSVFDLSGKLIHGFLIDNVVANSNIIIENENLLLKKGMYIIEIKSIYNDYKQKLEVK